MLEKPTAGLAEIGPERLWICLLTWASTRNVNTLWIQASWPESSRTSASSS